MNKYSVTNGVPGFNFFQINTSIFMLPRNYVIFRYVGFISISNFSRYHIVSMYPH
jgi:hypothetical protein